MGQRETTKKTRILCHEETKADQIKLIQVFQAKKI
jgi:hypothetical protein